MSYLVLLLYSMLMLRSCYFSSRITDSFLFSLSLPSHLVTNHDHQGESIIHDGPNFGPYHLAHGDWFGMDIHPIPVIEV